jgi:hypothetical protein
MDIDICCKETVNEWKEIRIDEDKQIVFMTDKDGNTWVTKGYLDGDKIILTENFTLITDKK